MSESRSALITGALSYSGKFIAARLLDEGWAIRTITGHADRPNPFGRDLEILPLDFEHPELLAQAFEGVDVFFNTYWVRFNYAETTFDRAVENSRALFTAAAQAHVSRVVHISITNPSLDSPFPYFRGKAQVEDALKGTGLPHSMVRPTVIYGGGDVFINNIAWIARRFPFFGIPGGGEYRIRPVHVEDVADICVSEASQSGNRVVDAVGPETYTFKEFVRLIAMATGSWAPIIPVPSWASLGLSKVISTLTRDVVVTADELGGLMSGLVTTEGPATGTRRFSEWLEENKADLGKRYESEVNRNYIR